MANCKPVSTPMVTRECERKGENYDAIKEKENEKTTNIPYRQAVGSLLYLANGTRPDITYAVNVVSRKQANYTMENWVQIKRIFRYLRGTMDLGLKYESKGEKLECYVDASLGTSDEEGKSTSGLIIKLFNDVIYWRTKKQTHVSLSSSEAEYIGMSLACKELVSLREMCRRILKYEVTPVLFEDSKSAINIAKSDDPQSLKHIVKLCYHYVRLEVAKGNVNIQWISTNDQLADIFTKALGTQKFEHFRKQMLTDDKNA